MGPLKKRFFGIRAKLSLGVGVVMFVSALVFGTLYALIERASVLDEKQDHLAHVASIAKLSFESLAQDSVSSGIAEFNRHLSAATGATHHVWIEGQDGRLLFGRRGSSSGRLEAGSTAFAPTAEIWSALFPASMSYSVPVRIEDLPNSANLVVEESLGHLPGDLVILLAGHVGFAVVLFCLVAFSISLVAHYVILRPVGELVRATEKMGQRGEWDRFVPSTRRRDEIGILCERFAGLSRRLESAVRDERYSSAHLVAVGVERSLEEPLRHAEMELALLQASLPAVTEERARCENLSAQLAEIAQVARRLKRIGAHPASRELG